MMGADTSNLHGSADPDWEQAWDMEIRRRIEELDSGAVETIPWEEVRERLFGGLSDPLRSPRPEDTKGETKPASGIPGPNRYTGSDNLNRASRNRS